MKPGFLRTFAIVGALGAGLLIPEAFNGIVAVRWLISGMLFLVFVQTKMSWTSFHPTHLVLLLANFAIAGIGYGVGWWLGGPNVALAGFFAGITPTAIAAPVIMGFLGGRVDYVITSFVLSNFAVTLLLPFILPWLLGHPTPHVFLEVSRTIGGLVVLPFIAGLILRTVFPPAVGWAKKCSGISFLAWNVSLFLVMSNASHFLRTQTEIPHRLAWEAAGVSALTCVLSFGIGKLIGGKNFGREASQSLGQKNTTFTLYVALLHANPLVALGPTSYVLWHNLWNSWQLYRTRSPESPANPKIEYKADKK